MKYITKDNKIFIAGHKGMVGSAIFRNLKNNGYHNLLTANRVDLDLTDTSRVKNWYKIHKPDVVIIAAAKVGGIYSNNKYKADFIYSNLSIQNNIIHSAFKCKIKNLIFLGSSCVYPRLCRQPIKENYLLNGELEKTNEPYAIAKIAGIKMCESYNYQYRTNYRCLMPTNTFGPNDDYDDFNSHFIPALIKKVHKIKIKNLKQLILWGNGKAKREAIYVDDIADACIFFMKKRTKEALINIGTGKDYSIQDYAKMILKTIIPKKKIKIKYDLTKPNGTPRKVLNVSLAKNYGWSAKFKLRDSLLLTYKNYVGKN